jgi:hypothetical protein
MTMNHLPPQPSPIVLSRRNLMYLLSRLDAGEKQPMLLKPGVGAVAAETDEEHYRDRGPGRIREEAQQFAADVDAFLAIRRRWK